MLADEDSSGARDPAPVDVMMLVDTGSMPDGAEMTLEVPAALAQGSVSMFAPLARGARSDGSSHLQIEGRARVSLRIWASSLSDQLDDEVFIVRVTVSRASGALDTHRMRFETVSDVAMVPQPARSAANPPTFVAKDSEFNYVLLPVRRRPGSERLRVTFVVYGPPEAGGTRPIKGYYRHDVSITVAPAGEGEEDAGR